MALDPQIQALREQWLVQRTPPVYTLTIGQARTADLAAILASSGDPEPVGQVIDREIPAAQGPRPIRIYLPYDSSTKPLPVLVYFFGGGWALGTIDTCDGICRMLTNQVRCATVAVGYRLAPEHKFPAAVLDCQAGVEWVAEHIGEFGENTSQLAVAGDSAGGNLAAAVSLLARDKGGPTITAQVLVCPNTDYHSDSESLRGNDDPAFFNRKSVDWYWKHYLRDPSDGSNWLASPLRATDHTQLPPALIITAEYDPLRDQGEQYADALVQAGVPVTKHRYLGMVHGFFTMTGTVDASRAAVAEVAEYLRASFTRSTIPSKPDR
jgi:acetyl esterase